MKKIITIKNWKRPQMYHSVLTALNNCIGINGYEIWNFVDPLGSFPAKFQEIDASHPINTKCKVKTIVLDQPQGCARNTYHCFAQPFDDPEVDFVIHLEDDTIPSKDFVQYMEWAQKEFQNDEEVFVVVGYNFQKDNCGPNEFIENINKVHRRIPTKTYQAWGIWRDRWEEVQDGWFGIHWKGGEPGVIHEGDKFLEQIKKADDGSWGWPMLKYWRKGRYEIAPVISRCQNIGSVDGRFNSNPQWHQENVWTRQFADHYVASNYEVL